MAINLHFGDANKVSSNKRGFIVQQFRFSGILLTILGCNPLKRDSRWRGVFTATTDTPPAPLDKGEFSLTILATQNAKLCPCSVYLAV
jgi:hypothetical protein